jgi:hypothetical protein
MAAARLREHSIAKRQGEEPSPCPTLIFKYLDVVAKSEER